jgi:hypothetical protein
VEHATASAQKTGNPERTAIYEAAAAVYETHFGNEVAAKEGARAVLGLAKAAMWSMPRPLRWPSQATSRNREGSPPTWRNAFPEDTPVQI